MSTPRPSFPWRAACALLALGLPALAGPDVPERGELALVDVHVLTMRGDEVLEHQTLVVRDGRVVGLGPLDELAPPAGARVVEGGGRWVLPGLAEMHGHLPGADAGDTYVDDVLWLYLAHGVTTVRGMLGDERQLRLAEEIAAGERLGPRLFVGSPPLHGGSAPSVERVRELVAAHAASGYDHLKVHEGLQPDVYAALAAAADEHGLDFGGHVPDAVGLRAAVDAGQCTIDHLDNVVAALVPDDVAARHPQGLPADVIVAEADLTRLPALAERMRAAGAAVVPTLALWEVFLGEASGAELRAARPEVRWMPPAVVDQWERSTDQYVASGARDVAARMAALRLRALAGLHAGGVRVLLGTDSPQLFSVPGASLHHELDAMARAGLGPADVLRAGTAAVGAFYDDEAVGRVGVGARADLLLLDADPREDARRALSPAGVLVDGRWLSREALDAGLAEIAARHGS